MRDPAYDVFSTVLRNFHYIVSFYFRRSLWTYLIRKATPLLAGLVAYADTNCNLNIIHEDHPEWIHTLWIDMLNDSEVTPLTYSDLPGEYDHFSSSDIDTISI